MAKTGAPQFRIRLDAEMKDDLEEDALAEGRSLNGEIEYRLRAYERYRGREERKRKREERRVQQERDRAHREKKRKQERDRNDLLFFEETITIRKNFLRELEMSKIGKEIRNYAEYDLLRVEYSFKFYREKFNQDYGFDYTDEKEFLKSQEDMYPFL